jgi:hypothetical protein
MSVRNDMDVNRLALRELLTAERVRTDAFSLGDVHPDECLCLDAVAGGRAVYYTERGLRTGERLFDTEDEACDFMAARLLADLGKPCQPQPLSAGPTIRIWPLT